jgi:hypothetical protein
MKELGRRLWLEPALFLGVVNAAVQAVQLEVLDLSTGANLAIAVIGASLQALITRSGVVPLQRLGDQVVAEVGDGK